MILFISAVTHPHRFFLGSNSSKQSCIPRVRFCWQQLLLSINKEKSHQRTPYVEFKKIQLICKL